MVPIGPETGSVSCYALFFLPSRVALLSYHNPSATEITFMFLTFRHHQTLHLRIA